MTISHISFEEEGLIMLACYSKKTKQRFDHDGDTQSLIDSIDECEKDMFPLFIRNKITGRKEVIRRRLAGKKVIISVEPDY
jgi:hypothetical protein